MRIEEDGVVFDVFLEDDGTLDTVLSVTPREEWAYHSQLIRYSDTSDYRREDGSFVLDGFINLAHDAASQYEFE